MAGRLPNSVLCQTLNTTNHRTEMTPDAASISKSYVGKVMYISPHRLDNPHSVSTPSRTMRNPQSTVNVEADEAYAVLARQGRSVSGTLL